jgi:CBS domain-containing protein
MTAQSIMSTKLTTITPDVTVGEAMMIMCAHKVHNLPVVDDSGSFVGLFSLRRVTHELLPMAARVDDASHLLNFDMSFLSDHSDDYLERLRRIGDKPVSTLLEKKKKLRFCSPDTPIPKLLQLLTENPTSLPVVVLDGEQQKVVGMVSTWDVLTKIALSLYGEDDKTDNKTASAASSNND